VRKWYAVQTYAGSELKVAEQLEERLKEYEMEKWVEEFETTEAKSHFLVPVEEVITSKSRRGQPGDLRVPYYSSDQPGYGEKYDIKVDANKRIQRGDLVALKEKRYLGFDATIKDTESLHRVVVELTNRNEEVYLVDQDSRLRRDIRVGERVLSGVPLTMDSDPRYMLKNRGKVVVRDRVKRLTFERKDGEVITEIIPERYLVKLKKGQRLKEGDLLEREDKVVSRATGMVKIKEYKDKRVVTVQRIEKRRLFPGYLFVRMDMNPDTVKIVSGDIKCRFVGDPPIPIREDEMKVVKRKVGLLEMPKRDKPKIEVDFNLGEVVEIIEGPFADFTGEITAIDKDHEELTVIVKIFGRETPVTLNFEGVEKL
jgi:transcriptional antiterminator NusG